MRTIREGSKIADDSGATQGEERRGEERRGEEMATQVDGNPARRGEERQDEAREMATQVDGNTSSAGTVGVDPAASNAKDPSRKLRILCLHGFRTSGTILAQQVQMAKWAPLINEIAELVFIDAPWPAGGKSDVEKWFPGPYFEWYQSSEDYTEIWGIDESTAYFTDYLSLHGPFDGLLGFSQGGVLAGAWMGLHEKGMGPNISTIKFLIVVGGGRANAHVLQPAYIGDPIQCPSLHFLGDKDFMKPFAEALISACKDPVVIKHPLGHVVPKLSASDGQILKDFLLKQLQSKISS